MVRERVVKSSIFATHDWTGREKKVEWRFHPGMLFGSNEKWWAQGKRATLHEGLDFYSFQDSSGKIHHVTEKTSVPLLFDGVIAAIFDDFLGKTVLVEHAQYPVGDNHLLTLYGHMIPYPHVKPGRNMAAGELLGVAAGSDDARSKVPAHLHLSVALVPPGFAVETLTWQSIAKPPVVLCDPMLHLTINDTLSCAMDKT